MPENETKPRENDEKEEEGKIPNKFHILFFVYITFVRQTNQIALLRLYGANRALNII